MKKIILLIIMLMLCFQTVMALTEPLYPLCEDTREIYVNCSMLTPDLICSGTYTYDVINMSGEIQTTGTLKQLNGTIYYLNLTENNGDYIVRLCDNTTREIRILENDDKMIPSIIIVLPAIIAFIIILSTFGLGEEHKYLKTFLSLIIWPLFFISFHWGVLALSKFYDWNIMVNNVAYSIWVFGAIFIIILAYWLIYMIKLGLKTAAQEKDSRFDYGK